MKPRSQRELVWESRQELQPNLRADQLRPIQLHFLKLMDEAAAGVIAHGLDLDDCEVERWAWVHLEHDPRLQEILVDGLSDSTRLLRTLSGPCLPHEPATPETPRVRPDQAWIAALGVRAFHDSALPTDSS